MESICLPRIGSPRQVGPRRLRRIPASRLKSPTEKDTAYWQELYEQREREDKPGDKTRTKQAGDQNDDKHSINNEMHSKTCYTRLPRMRMYCRTVRRMWSTSSRLSLSIFCLGQARIESMVSAATTLFCKYIHMTSNRLQHLTGCVSLFHLVCWCSRLLCTISCFLCVTANMDTAAENYIANNARKHCKSTRSQERTS